MNNFVLIENRYLICPKLEAVGLKVILTVKPYAYSPFKNVEAENFKHVKSVLNTTKPFYYMIQKHTNNIVDIRKTIPIEHSFGYCYQDVDGLLGDQSAVLFSTYADCTPVVLYDAKQKLQINCHSGWRGTLQGIVKNGLHLLINTNQSDPKDIYCLIGPHLLFDDFEVTDEVLMQFKQKFPNPNYYRKKDATHSCIDTLQINLDYLAQADIPDQNIIVLKQSTLNSPLFHSYRTDKQNFKQMALFSMIQPPDHVMDDDRKDSL